MTLFLTILISCIAALFGCVRRIPEPAAQQTTPRISWVIRAGAEFAQQRVVCQSDPKSECVIPASSQTPKEFAGMSLYLHPTKAPTAYRGSLEVTFFETGTGVYGTPVDRTVEPGDQPVGITVSGVLKQMPGQYVAAIALIAYPSRQTGREIREAVNVIVK